MNCAFALFFAETPEFITIRAASEMTQQVENAPKSGLGYLGVGTSIIRAPIPKERVQNHPMAMRYPPTLRGPM